MKSLLTVFFLTLLSVGCHYSVSRSSSNPQLNATFDAKNTRTFLWAETGLVFTLLQGWRRDIESDDNSQRAWIALDSSRFSVTVSTPEAIAAAGIKVIERSIDDETTQFYEDHNRYGEQDLRYLEIDGVRGVHYLRDNQGWDADYRMQDEKFVIWNAQRMYKGERQIINVTLSAPSKNFTKDRDTLYGLLQAIKFTQNHGGSSESTEQTINDSGGPANTEQMIDKSSVVVSIPNEDEFYIGKRRVARAEIVTEIDQLLRDRPEEKQIAYVKAAPEIKYGAIVSIIDDIGALGYGVGLVADKKKSQTAPKVSSTRETTPGKKDVSERSGAKTTGADDLLVVTVEMTKAGTIIIKIGETPVPLSQLANKVRRILNDRNDKAVKILAPGSLQYESIVAVIDELKAGGAKPIGFGIKSP